MIDPSLTGRLKSAELWLAGIGACLIAIHLTLLSRTTQASLLGSSALFWLVVAAQLWSRRHQVKVTATIGSALVGTLFILIVLVRSALTTGYDPFLRLSPLLSLLGLALLTSRFTDLKQYWREALILCFLVPSPGALAFIIDISTQTAQFSNYLLWNLGFDVVRQGTYIYLPNGSIEVYPGCSGLESMVHLLGLAITFLLLFPTRRIQKVFVPVAALLIGFVVNGIRVALMAYLASYSTQQSLDYWHIGQGSLVFSMISVFIFGLLGFQLLQEDDEAGDSLE